MIIVGELINATRKAVREAMEARDAQAIQALAKDQADAGADFLDINAGVFMDNEAESLKWVIDAVSGVSETPFCIDSSTAETIEAALAYLETKQGSTPMVNSISMEKTRFNQVMPLIKGSNLKVVALCMNDESMPETADQRLAIADVLINELVKNDIPIENIYVDPLVQALAANSAFGMEFLNAVDRIMTEYPGIHTICGLSNISYGMPARKFMNQTLMTMAVARGLDGAIMDPLDKRMMANIITAEALAGKDNFSMNYIKAFRDGKLP
ncbi:5-methyltetrahydrofolate--homocysteine methyltransferase [Desulfatibacillum alkenivorans DSM 16219]|jgi:5-methyltetrahydrofolate--homocysteine methyltransferase|uniref:5-methyltetrahydrofolate--homocysteine methyltransferase n=1 Tax=Desulfatibacillum alkenivorans DSM 16219 TaxID=1121393 RepID=A0A1M6XPD8_9BACT|nr:dihydropteroate synthase [Desulfatibacillum alkenivorans]SHL07796.1 5-methyltetrahydrofolate--homocysteine methyltransferase [Desulfatibacillum alkenivorans DSM 16219]